MAAARSCTNSDCSFDETGECVEAQDVETCRYRTGRVLIADLSEEGPPETERAEADGDGDIEVEAESLGLRVGGRLLSAECRGLREAEDTRIVSILAPKDAGKTSLIAGLYEVFLEGIPDSFFFAGSDSLLALENLCHLSRATSNRTRNDMLRTRRAEGLGFFHLKAEREGRQVGLLLGDRPGETVREAAQGLGAASALQELRSSDAVLYLIDGALLSTLATRNLPLSDAEAILESLTAAKLLDHKPPLGLVLTKADLVEAAGGDSRFDEIVQSLSRRFGDRFGPIEVFRTAAGADSTETTLPRGYGLNTLMAFLLNLDRPVVQTDWESSEPKRQFSRFGRRGGAA